MSKPKSERSKHVDTIIRNHVIWSMGAGLIPVLIADIFAVSALQLDMIRQMAKVYDIDFKETQGKAVVTSLTSSTLARLGAGSVIKLIPGVGSIIGGATVSIFAGASTYALGEVFKRHFQSGGTILDFDPDRLRNYYKEKFEKGKKVAKEWEKEAKAADIELPIEPEVPSEEPRQQQAAVENPEEELETASIVSKLKELAKLKEDGILTEEEFGLMKQRLLDSY